MKTDINFKDKLLNILLKMNNLLTIHIEIHNSVFNPPKRAAIPIPFVFKKIDFKKLNEMGQKNKEDLEGCIDKLMDISQEVAALDRELIGVVRGYATRFLSSITKLNDIAESLYLKSENLKDFVYQDYNKLVIDYNQDEENRIEMSEEINGIARKLLG